MVALGFTLIFGVLRRANLAFGPSIMFGVYSAVWLGIEFQLASIALMLAAVGATVVMGLYVERLCFAPHRNGSAIAAMIASFALWMQIEELATVLLPRHVYEFPELYRGGVLELGPIHLYAESAFVLLAACLASASVWAFLFHTRTGLAARALVASPKAAACCGINAGRISMVVFAIASVIGGVAGYLVAASHGQVTPMLGMWATLKGLIAMMLGGLGSLPGAIIGGLCLGMLEAQAQWYFGPQLRDLLVYLLVFSLLALRAPWMNSRSA